MWIRAVLCALLCVLSACSGSDSSSPAASDQQPSTSPPPGTSSNPPTTNPPPAAGGAGPWPTADLTVYASAQSLTGTVINPDSMRQDAPGVTSLDDATLRMMQGLPAFLRASNIEVQAADGVETASNR